MIALDSATSLAAANADTASANSLKNTLNSNLSNASDEKLMGACKEFASYFIEQVIKEAEKTVKITGDDDKTTESKYVDYFKDSAITQISDEITDQSGDNFIQTLYEQMKRNYS